MQPVGDWMLTTTGEKIYLLDPKPGQIKIEDIAVALSRIPRFVGHTRSDMPAYSVAQHSVLVSQICPEYPLAALLHDAHETYIGDISSPMKRSINDLQGGVDCSNALKAMAACFDDCIAAKFDIDVRDMHSQEVKRADLVALATEARDLVNAEMHEWNRWLGDIQPLPRRIRPLSSQAARALFTERFKELTQQPSFAPEITQLVALTGFAGCGKDAAAVGLIDAGFTRKCFGDIIKKQIDHLCVAYLGFSAFTSDRDKKSQIRGILEQWGEANYDSILSDYFKSIDGDTVNTRLCRTREAIAWRERGGKIIEVIRPGVGPATQWESDRLEELRSAGLIDGQLVNDGSIEDLQQRIVTITEGLYASAA